MRSTTMRAAALALVACAACVADARAAGLPSVFHAGARVDVNARGTGTLTLTAGPRKWPAGRKRFAIAPGAATRIRVTLGTRARSVLRRRGRVTLTATAVTTEPSGRFGATKGAIVVSSRRSR